MRLASSSLLAVAATLFVDSAPQAQPANPTPFQQRVIAAMQGEIRTAEERARDVNRMPAEILEFFRMRENMRLYKAMPLREIIDLSINETLARSLYTSVTAFLSLLPMAIWGGSAVESFAIPMVFGIVVAAASSVFIAAPILLFLGDWRTRHRAVAANEGKVDIIPPGAGQSPRKSAS